MRSWQDRYRQAKRQNGVDRDRERGVKEIKSVGYVKWKESSEEGRV